MKPPAVILEEADLLAYVEVPPAARFTGRLHLFVDGTLVGPVPHLAILQPHAEPGLYLVHCDESWGLVGIQAWDAPGVEPISSVDAMKVQAERYYEGLMPYWKEISGRDA